LDIIGEAQALLPFLQPDSAQALQKAAQMGAPHLNNELKKHSQDCDCGHGAMVEGDFQVPKHGDCDCGGGKSNSDYHPSLPLLEQLAEMIGNDRGLQFELQKASTQCEPKVGQLAFHRLFNWIGESLPERRATKVLENVLEMKVLRLSVPLV
jgi:hypothetical protein